MNSSDRLRSGQFNLKNVLASLFRVCLGLGAAVFLIVTLIGLLGVFDGGYDAVNHFRIFFVVPGLALAFLALILRWRLVVAATTGALLVHGFTVVPEVYAAFRPPAADDRSQPIKIITFNVANRFVDRHALRRFIRDENPDLLVVQEAWGAGAAAVGRLSDLMPHKADCMNVRRCNLAIFSRHPVASRQYRPQADGPASGNAIRFVKADINIVSQGGKPRTITVMTTHLSWPVPHERQERQFRQLADMVSAEGHERMILAGDFNSTPWSHAMHRFDRSVPLKRVTRALASWPGPAPIAGIEFPYPILPIDHVLIGSKIRETSVRRGPYLGSDHYPVIVELALQM